MPKPTGTIRHNKIMDPQSYFLSLNQETDALKDRIRFLIEDRHWQTDGEWKESVIRYALRRHVPDNAKIGRGFIVGASFASRQIDVLIYDAAKPVLFRDGDLAFVTPDAVIGIIEVKTKLNPVSFAQAASKLGTDINLVRSYPNSAAFAAIVSFEGDGLSEAFLKASVESASTWNERVDFAAIGNSRFLRYWHLNPLNDKQLYQSWHSYQLPGLAIGYFIHNVIDMISPESVLGNTELWFPSDGKEGCRDGCLRAKWA